MAKYKNEIYSTLDAVCKSAEERVKKENEEALKLIKRIVHNEKHITLGVMGKDAIGQDIVEDYENTIESLGVTSWSDPENCNIVALYEDDGKVYARVSDEAEKLYDYTLDEVIFDAVKGASKIVKVLLEKYTGNGNEKR